ncbi:hypothetical protein [Lentzea sp. CC55]|uniref:hypothetical protein n=1 Tax=Lentzea sp. CC55 TaxID=2884909 RepID=UPI001F406A65|nr:hypothetical protein [Lentzea sp. CC55]MCG8927695.1 hypothetical protein [Lentzea sp. CC55]
MFRRLALIPGAHFSEELAAIVAGVPSEEVQAPLDELIEASVLTVTAARMRLQFHDLVWLFARERLAAEEPENVRAQLQDALLTHVLRKTTAAGKLFLTTVTGVSEGSPFASQAEAEAWLEQEATSWLPVLRRATEARRYREVVDCTWPLYNYAHGRYAGYHWTDVFELGVHAARGLGDRTAEVDLPTQYGAAFQWGEGLALASGISVRALRELERAVTLSKWVEQDRIDRGGISRAFSRSVMRKRRKSGRRRGGRSERPSAASAALGQFRSRRSREQRPHQAAGHRSRRPHPQRPAHRTQPRPVDFATNPTNSAASPKTLSASHISNMASSLN